MSFISELIKIRSPENAIAIAGETFEIFFNISALIDEIRVNVSHDGNFVTTISSISNNATYNFTIPTVDRGSEGIYEFVAYPIDGSFSFKSTTTVSVHGKWACHLNLGTTGVLESHLCNGVTSLKPFECYGMTYDLWNIDGDSTRSTHDRLRHCGVMIAGKHVALHRFGRPPSKIWSIENVSQLCDFCVTGRFWPRLLNNTSRANVWSMIL